MTQEKKMYVVFCEDSEKYWCSYNTWSDQLRKATIFHSTKYVNEVHKRFKELRLKNVEVRMEVVPEKPTNADRIRSMADDELNELFHEIYNAGAEDAVAYEWGQRTNSFEWTMDWLQQPTEEADNG